jgi:hypothetical protein
MKTKLPGWPLKELDELSPKKILSNFLLSFLKKNQRSIILVKNRDQIFGE